MPELTFVGSPDGWHVYRVRTLSSEYLLGLFRGALGRRPCAILRGLSRGLGQVIDLQDSAPLIGGKSLFDVPPEEWTGKAIEIGTAVTSTVQSVEEERDAAVIASLTRAAAQVVAAPKSPAPQGQRRIFVGKDVHKFSSAHMTVLPDGSKERLHGHNFQVSVAVELARASVADLIDLRDLKEALATQCAAWDQRLLLAARCPELHVLSHDATECEFTLCGRRYIVPADEVTLLPITNVVVEELAELFASLLVDRLRPSLLSRGATHLEVNVTESSNQGGSFRLALAQSG